MKKFMNYTLHQLQIFVEVVRFKSITKAAASMHMTQPALSIQLKNFQQQFEHPLIEIIGKKLYVTDLGISISKLPKQFSIKLRRLSTRLRSTKGCCQEDYEFLQRRRGSM